MRAELERYRQPGLTDKNRAVVRQVLVDHVWRSVMRVPERLLAEATAQQNAAPVRAAVAAGLAVAIRILIVAPIRVGNLAGIRIGENLIRPAGPRGTLPGAWAWGESPLVLTPRRHLPQRPPHPKPKHR